jgi:arylformamidase
MRHTPAWYDQQYNVRLGLPNYPELLARWVEWSAQARQDLPCVLDVPYTELGASDPSERLDVFMPQRATPGGAPVLVHIHGGYWRALDKREQSFVASDLSARGALVVVPNYALCPKVSIAHIVMQLVQALAWVWRNAARYGGNPDRIVVTGHSAGGHLTAMMLACQWPVFAADLPSDLVKVAVPVSGLFELEPLRHAPFLASDIGLTAAEAIRLSPACLPSPGRGQLRPFVGGLESPEFHRQSRQIRRAWGPKVVAPAQSVPGRHHIDVLHNLNEPGSVLHQALVEALGL